MSKEWVRCPKRDTWHSHPFCSSYRAMVKSGVKFIKKHTKPKSGEFCNQCMAKWKNKFANDLIKTLSL